MSDSESDWELDPLFITHAPTQKDINKSVGLKAVQALIYENAEVTQTTYKTQGNNCLEVALKKTGDERKQMLIQALQHYTNAIEVQIDVSDKLTQQTLNERLAVIYSNRSEIYRLLQDLARSNYDALKAIELNPNYFKSYLRLARICEDLGDWLRNEHFLQIALKFCDQEMQRKTISQQIEKAVKNLKSKEAEYVDIYKRIKKLYDFMPSYGLLLPYVNLSVQQIFQSFQSNAFHLYLLDNNTREILTIETTSINSTFLQIKDIIGQKNVKIFYETQWCDAFDGIKFVKADTKQRKRVYCQDTQTLRSVLQNGGYVIPGIVCFFME